jgi:hypothetical protein
MLPSASRISKGRLQADNFASTLINGEFAQLNSQFRDLLMKVIGARLNI